MVSLINLREAIEIMIEIGYLFCLHSEFYRPDLFELLNNSSVRRFQCSVHCRLRPPTPICIILTTTNSRRSFPFCFIHLYLFNLNMQNKQRGTFVIRNERKSRAIIVNLDENKKLRVSSSASTIQSGFMLIKLFGNALRMEQRELKFSLKFISFECRVYET